MAWTLTGRGQWNNQPYDYGASDWRGIPYSQRDTSGNMLTKYSNMVDQLSAAQQPISVGQPFARWAFGRGLMSGGGQRGGGQPPIAVDPGTSTPGAWWSGGGNSTPPTTNPPASPPGADPGWGSSPPTPATTGKTWQGFTFSNPTEGFQSNFNYLAGIDPMLAFSYAFNPTSGSGNAMDTKHAVDAYMGGNYGNPLINAFDSGAGQGGGAQGSSLGIAPDWYNPRVALDPTGRILTSGNNTYNLPFVDQSYVQQTPWWQQGANVMPPAPAQAPSTEGSQLPGGDAWWAAVAALQGGK